MSSDNGKVIDLRAIQNPIAGKVQLSDGVHEVRKFNAEQYQLAMRLTGADPEAILDLSVKLVAESMPTVPIAQVQKFGPELLTTLITLASQGVEAVEAAFPNAGSPEPPTSPG